MSPAYHVYENAKSKTDSVPAVAPYNYIDPQNGQLVRQGTRMRQSALYIHPACGAPGCASYGSTNSGGIGCSIYGGPMFEPAKSGQQGIYILVDRNRPNQFVKGE